MKKRSWQGLLPLLLLIVGCTGCTGTPATTPAPASEAAPVQAESSPTDTGSIEGVVVPAQQSTLSFLVGGSVSALNIAEGDLVQAGDALITLSTPELDSVVSMTESSLDAAVADLQYWLLPRKYKPPERRWLAEDRVEAAKATVETARAMQAQQTLLAPYAATVINTYFASGEVVNPLQVVILLADLENLKIETSDLSERDVVNVKIGQRALVYIEAFDLEVGGKVTAIATLADTSTNDVLYTATIELNETPANLRWGMSVTIDFETNE
ncbi:MAG: HlyD family efflux transporter periplasmic adaptor subunit [Anaerolineae bacterium]|jgi:multidrug efflux pump subunit AcrA (membrane-fusion protein)|nr:HlyD family efflux transporter periplasmic adaptor subunit [Anaerolineae bacterium]MBT7069905.1 HlyD family efflux transporter periplasmic adaptor subunit [Anaerolineae bacterium]MBT7323864.1 HlyD family efflux transporter periplasmic adaptor subunit [Anaerolineae bacterium]